jgi:predicted aldo/keto reductase-like oxidoreductase
MRYIRFGQLDWQVSALGFGAMRLPIIDDDPARIDEPEAIRMIRHAIDQGVNYVDTAYPYHRETSEPLVARALHDGYRERVRVATKMPCWLVKEYGDFDRYLNEQLERLEIPKIDFYLLHGLGEQRWSEMRDLKVLDWAEGAMADGRIGHLGFSFHDQVEAFEKIVDGYDNWTFCQIQYNYMDEEHQAGTRGLKYAADRGLAVVVMEPVRGGQLAKNLPSQVMDLWNSAPIQRSPAEWALRWVWDRPEVTVVLSGMSTMEQVVENLATAADSGPGRLTADELVLIERVRDTFRGLAPIPCTDCQYCLPCPNGVSIPRILAIYNEVMTYQDPGRGRWFYSNIPEGERADACIACGDCEQVCPQHITIIEWLEKAHELLKPVEEAG